MTEITRSGAWQQSERASARLRKRYRGERRLKIYGIVAIGIALAMLAVLLSSVIGRGYSAFVQTHIELPIHLEASEFEAGVDEAALRKANYRKLLREGLFARFPEVTEPSDRRKLLKLMSPVARYEVMDYVLDHPEAIGSTPVLSLSASSDVDMLMKGKMAREAPEAERRLNDRQIAWIDQLIDADAISKPFNWSFFSHADSREPEAAGIGGAVLGSFWTLLITLVLAFPIGVTAASYLEEFAPKNRVTNFIEVNINNLAAVPSIVFGLLGLAIFIQVFHLPRSAPIVGGLTLMLMTLPTIIISTRAALAAVPPSIREAAHGVGASPIQVVTHHVLPLAMPGIMTGTIIGMARALGETAPLLMIGMVAFIVDIPGSPFDAATALPVQVFLWADNPERGFEEKMSAAIIVLLAFLIAMNTLAIYLRRRFEVRW